MNRRGLITLAAATLGFTLFAAAPAQAQEVNLATLDEAPANRVYLRTGAEFAFVASIGYARAVALGQHRMLLQGEVTVPWAGFDMSDYQLRVRALVPLVSVQRWKLAASLAPTLRGTKNEVGRMTGLGFDGGTVAGYYAPHWFVAGELGFDYTLTTHVTNSQLYRDAVYADARDGWYINPGGNFRLGAQAGASLGRYDIILRAGELREMNGGRPMFPLYATLTFATRW
jgi:hypothetical protein